MRIGIITNNEYALYLIHALKARGLEVHVFFCPSPDPFANQQVEAFMQAQHIACAIEKNADKDLYNWIKSVAPDVVFVSGYPRLIDIKKTGNLNVKMFNIHSGALPGFRGPSPVFWQLKLGVPKLTVSIHLLSEKFDDGPVVWMKEIDNMAHYNCRLADMLLSQLSTEGVFFILQLIMHSLPVVPVAHKNGEMKYYKKPAAADVTITWDTMTADEIVRLVKACNPWNKGAITFINSTPIKITDATAGSEKRDEPPGTIVAADAQLTVVCSDNQIIHINMLFYNDFFLPAYYCRIWGIIPGRCFG
ncbi:formyltransferase family protein [Sediminibacterium ginsengisoli]|uniref:Methionyl-tRNA formyltransferase n=1 Tax=Sediminibacterium ginsengisoli TaxID=413434 RepID=A0A1T4L674_9BACT|nr:formyltransferase family protein [Sediminibacterium ginsengisoli]SJZ50087.1 methionyl-tRNA formyltransferase [Sediminibacterium ginsengisoli]